MTQYATDAKVRGISENTVPEGYLHESTPILVIMGVCGCGKTSVGTTIAQRQGWDSAEGDDFHPQANIDKMAAGVPLTDDDRWGWLDKLAGWIREHIESGKPGVMTCSALKRVYRDKLRMPGVVFVYLSGDYDTVMDMLSHRTGHYMKPAMLDSQFEILEPPAADEVHVSVDLDQHLTIEEESQAVLDALQL
ncbi:gluconokinase [Bifidobacterium sp.]|jgi:carbohydrate kinase (thermoresistant glucokinase family)|uniref:gluconokinase n=1 Tax=Bifidobacterium sp. TaxID=41200 RepID=UPI0025BA5BC4|nr:gluconokinase [Bifidobacterium sp.]MCH4208829.1 gluconokinase [Bifidobacterium sp.]MCI1225365.1 gluconokinase [Bifidobacterium sp.]